MHGLGDWPRLDADEIATKRFHTVLRGWDTAEVRDFLERVAAEHEALVAEADRWRAIAEALVTTESAGDVTPR